MVEIVPTEDLPLGRSLIRIVSAPGAEPGRDIAAVTIGAGLGLHELRRTRATLEDVFLELTTQELPLTQTDAGREIKDTEQDQTPAIPQFPLPNPESPTGGES
jgi:ABC-2 type transport system ATP-binding protein